MTKKQFIIDQIARLFISRNQTPIDQLEDVWAEDLMIYDQKKLEYAFNQYRRYGDDFPSLAKIIQLTENLPQPESLAAMAWGHVLKAIKKESSKGLNEQEKKVLNIVAGGLGNVMTMDSFNISQTSREFKRLYVDMVRGINIEPKKIPESNLKKIGLDVSKIGISDNNAESRR